MLIYKEGTDSSDPEQWLQVGEAGIFSLCVLCALISYNYQEYFSDLTRTEGQQHQVLAPFSLLYQQN